MSSSLLLLRRTGHLRISSPLSLSPPSPPLLVPLILLRSYHVGKAGSVNTAIQRGLRKSKGVGFRGKSKPHPNDPREVYRERNGIPAYDLAAAEAASLARKQFGDARQHDRLAGSDSRSLRGRDSMTRSSKHSRGEAILRSEGLVESEMRGRFGEKVRPRIRKFEYEETRHGRESNKERNFNPRAGASRFEAKSDARSNDRSSRPEYQSRYQGSTSKNDYPSLSFRDRSSESTSQSDRPFDKASLRGDLETRYSSSSKHSGSRFSSVQGPVARFPTPRLDRPVKFNDNKHSGRTTESLEPRSLGRDGGSADRYSSGRPSTRFSNRFGTGHSDQNAWLNDRNSSRRTSGSFDARSSGRMGGSNGGHFSKGMTRKAGTGSSESSVELGPRAVGDMEQPYGKRTHDRSEPTLRISQVCDKHLPLSMPYTTPASEFLYGASVVEAAIISRKVPKRKLYKLYIYNGEHRTIAERDSRLEGLARKNGIEVVRVGNDWVRLMDKMSSGRPHNGYILEASPLPRLPVTHLGELKSVDGQEGFEVSVDHQSREEAAVNGTSNFIRTTNGRNGRKPFVLLLDSIVDPGNLGGIIRTASFLGVSAIAISTRNSASFTPVVLKASAGASENITLFSVNKPAGFVVDSKAAGWRVYAAVAPSKRNDSSMPASLSTDELEDPLTETPCILMLGSEGEGLRWNLRSKADFDLYIRGCGQSFSVDSLNVSVATGILCNSFLSKKGGKVAVSVTDEPPVEHASRVESVTSTGALF
ncbi:hypothetical protein DL95DRAFT_385140 [Leptodontidium sp. 2 PMI_412]|nr:hypothetical protein DL95DRAFT_385140 [Leptodontidium sp. 2 PMI_412]